MDHVPFGRTGLRVSRLCLGTMTFGMQVDEAGSHAILDRAFDGGVTFIDTANMYPNGHSGELAGLTEEIIGRWMAGRRDDVVLATKFYAPMGGRPWQMGGSRRHILDAVDASLRRLQTDFIDLYQIHFWDQHTPLDETMSALDDLVRSGKVRYVGCSNYAAWQLARAVGRSEALGLVRYESVQPRYNLLFRNIERDLLPLCEHDQIAVIPYNPLAGGMLSGKHSANAGPTEGTRFTMGTAAGRYQERYWHDAAFELIDRIRPLAADADMSMVQLALAWVLATPGITSPIVGASRPEQLDDAFAALDTPLDPDLKATLDDMTMQFRLIDAIR